MRCLMVRVASRAISAWVTPSTRFALVALLRWWAWPMMRTATGSRGSAAPESGHVATPPPGGRGMAALASSMGVNDGWLHDWPVDHQRAPPRSWTTALDPPSTPRPTVTQIFLLQKIQVSLPSHVARWLRA